MKKQHVHVDLTFNLMLYEQLIQIQGKKNSSFVSL